MSFLFLSRNQFIRNPPTFKLLKFYFIYLYPLSLPLSIYSDHPLFPSCLKTKAQTTNSLLVSLSPFLSFPIHTRADVHLYVAHLSIPLSLPLPFSTDQSKNPAERRGEEKRRANKQTRPLALASTPGLLLKVNPLYIHEPTINLSLSLAQCARWQSDSSISRSLKSVYAHPNIYIRMYMGIYLYICIDTGACILPGMLLQR